MTPGTASAGTDYTASSGTLTFDAGVTLDTIQVPILGDVIDEGTSEAFTVDLSTQSNATISVATGTGTITDDDTAGFTLGSTSGLTVDESGTPTAQFTAVLNTQPITDVVLTVASANTDEVVADSATLTFTPSNWSTAKTIILTGVEELPPPVVDGPQVTLITVAVDDANSDDAFDGLGDQTFNVTTTDDDTPGFSVTASGGTTVVSEAGTVDTLSVVLSAAPIGNVVIDVSSADTGEATVAPSQLTFGPGDWSTPKLVVVTGVADAMVDGNQNTNVTFSIDDAATQDLWDAVPDTILVATTQDPGFTVTESGASTSATEGGTSDDISVVLTARPLTDVVITVTTANPPQLTASPVTLTFTTTNWDQAQSVTITAVNDLVVDGSVAVDITFAIDDLSSDNQFDALADHIVSATAIDDD
jgi:hypothetical protein